MLDQEVSIDKVIHDDMSEPVLQDDRPVNEFFLLRKISEPGYIESIPERLLRRERLF
jgi:hypothetical protein